ALQARGVNVVFTGKFAPNAPVVSGPATSNVGKPVWTWESGGGGGTGTYRYQLDGEAGVWMTTAGTSFTPSAALPVGMHTLYVQERNAAGLWSAPGSKAVEVLTAPSLVTNGSFESGVDPGAYLKLNAGSTALDGWTVGGAGVYYVGSYYQAGQGARCIKLTQQKPGWIAQAIPTTPGQTYRVTFLMAGDPFPYLTPEQKIKTLELSASAGGALVGSQQFTFDTTGKSVRNMGWDARSWEFTATSTETVLRIGSVSPGPYGPCVDNVVVTVVE
ncbi:MAG: choice-of-anchor C family protein, partial [FCB group bacterium]|nr:choice-of-anchor C family protein [FCB group bacterium]